MNSHCQARGEVAESDLPFQNNLAIHMLENNLGHDGIEILIAGTITNRSACVLKSQRFEKRNVFTTGTWTGNGFEKVKQKYQKTKNWVRTDCSYDPQITMCQQCHKAYVLMV